MIRSRVVAAVGHVVESSVSSGSLGGAGLVAVLAVVLGVLGLAFGLMRHHRKSMVRRAANRSIAAARAAAPAPRTVTTAPLPPVATTAPMPSIPVPPTSS